MTRRALLGSAAAAGVAAATFDPLRALAQATPGQSIAEQWTSYAQGLVPNAATAVGYSIVENGQTTATTLGTLVQDTDVLAPANTIFELGSVTKVFTAILLARTMDEYDLTLSEPLGDHLPPIVVNSEVTSLTLGNLAEYTNCLKT